MRGGSQVSYGRSVRAGLAFFTGRSVRAGAAFPAARAGRPPLPAGGGGDASVRISGAIGGAPGRSVHSGSLHGTRIDEAQSTGAGSLGIHAAEAEKGRAHAGGSELLHSEESVPDPIATPYAERLQSLLKVLELNQACLTSPRNNRSPPDALVAVMTGK